MTQFELVETESFKKDLKNYSKDIKRLKLIFECLDF